MRGLKHPTRNEKVMTEKLTNDQFNALARLVRSRGGVAEQAARFVLVEGYSNKLVQDVLNISPSRISDAIKLYRQALDLAYTASPGPK